MKKMLSILLALLMLSGLLPAMALADGGEALPATLLPVQETNAELISAVAAVVPTPVQEALTEQPGAETVPMEEPGAAEEREQISETVQSVQADLATASGPEYVTGDQVYDSDTTVDTLLWINEGVTVTIEAGVTVTLNSSVNNNGTIVLEDGARLICAGQYSTIAGQGFMSGLAATVKVDGKTSYFGSVMAAMESIYALDSASRRWVYLTLCEDTSLSPASALLFENHQFTLDLNGYELAVNTSLGMLANVISLWVKNNASLEILGGELIYNLSLTVEQSGSLTLSGGSLASTASVGIINRGGTVKICGGAVTSEGNTAILSRKDPNGTDVYGTVEISGGTLTGAVKTLDIVGGSLSISGSPTIHSAAAAEAMTLCLQMDDGVCPTVRLAGGIYPEGLILGGDTGLTLAALLADGYGYFLGETQITENLDGSSLAAGGDGTALTVMEIPSTTVVASVTVDAVSTDYTDLKKAFTAASGKTAQITLMADSEIENETLLLGEGSVVTMDLAGYAVSRKGSATGAAIELTGGAVLSIRGEGSITASGSARNVVLVGGSCILNLESGTLAQRGNSTTFALINSSGTVNITGGTLDGSKSAGTIIMTGTALNVSGSPSFLGSNTGKARFKFTPFGNLQLSFQGGVFPQGLETLNDRNQLANGQWMDLYNKKPLAEMLASGYRYVDEAGDPLAYDGGTTLLSGYVRIDSAAIKSSNTELRELSVNGQKASIDSASQTISIELPSGTVRPTDGSAITIVPVNGATVSGLKTEDDGASWSFTVTAEDGTTTAEYSLLVSVAAPEPGDYLLGDADGNGTVNARDATVVLRFDAGVIDETGLNTTAADVDGNGEVNARDATLILRKDAGVITKFPAEDKE